MSRYVDPDYDDVFYALNEFLKSHKPSELLILVQETVELWEENEDGGYNLHTRRGKGY